MNRVGLSFPLVLVGALLGATLSSCGKNKSPSAQGSSGSAGADMGSSAGVANGGSSGGGALGAGGSTGGSTSGAGGVAGEAGATDIAGATNVAGATSSGGADAGVHHGPPFGHPSPTVTPPTYPGFTLWLEEDFDEPLDLDTDPIWTWSDGGFQTHRFTRDAIGFQNGAMTITLSDTPEPASCSYSSQGTVSEMMRTSGELRSRYNLFRYGRYEARIKAPSVQPNNPVINGNYIASLFIFRQPACEDWREIDLEVTGNSPGYLVTNVIHSNDNCNTTEIRQDFDLENVNFRTGFQTIGFEWLPGTARYYRLNDDGTEVTLRQVADARVPELSAKLMANLWIFGNSFDFGGPEGANDMLPLQSEYDFIRFYKWDNENTYPCEAMDASCLAAADLDLTSNNGCDGIPLVGDFSTCMGCGTTLHEQCTAPCP